MFTSCLATYCGGLVNAWTWSGGGDCLGRSASPALALEAAVTWRGPRPESRLETGVGPAHRLAHQTATVSSKTARPGQAELTRHQIPRKTFHGSVAIAALLHSPFPLLCLRSGGSGCPNINTRGHRAVCFRKKITILKRIATTTTTVEDSDEMHYSRALVWSACRSQDRQTRYTPMTCGSSYLCFHWREPRRSDLRDGAECEDLAWEKALVRHSHHGVVALARTQIARLLAEDMTLTLAASSSSHVSKLKEHCTISHWVTRLPTIRRRGKAMTQKSLAFSCRGDVY